MRQRPESTRLRRAIAALVLPPPSLRVTRDGIPIHSEVWSAQQMLNDLAELSAAERCLAERAILAGQGHLAVRQLSGQVNTRTKIMRLAALICTGHSQGTCHAFEGCPWDQYAAVALPHLDAWLAHVAAGGATGEKARKGQAPWRGALRYAPSPSVQEEIAEPAMAAAPAIAGKER